MKKKIIFVTALLCAMPFGGCGNNNCVQESNPAVNTAIEENAEVQSETVAETLSEESTEDTSGKNEAANQKQGTAELPDGTYIAEFTTDSSMFRVNETCEGKGTLTVENGEMSIHISLMSKKIVNLYPGLAEDAEKDEAKLLKPTEDTVTYSDGLTEEVYGFDVPVPVLEEEFDLALIGTKGTWYDHKVKVSNPEPLEGETQTQNILQMEDGTYTVALSFEGGSGKAEILSPATVTVSGEEVIATVQWNSPNYDYMLVDGEKYLPVNTQGDSVFAIPVLFFDKPMDVIGDTVAMSTPHEIAYTLTFYSDTMKPAE